MINPKHMECYVLGISRCMMTWAVTHFQLDPNHCDHVWVRCDWSDCRTRSNGGSRMIDGRRGWGTSYAMKRRLRQFATDNFVFGEYDHIADDPVIGNYEGQCWEHVLNCLVAHEMSHVIQKGVRSWLPDHEVRRLGGGNRKSEAGHNIFWQNIYQDFRKAWVNTQKILLPPEEYKRLSVPWQENWWGFQRIS